MADGEEADVSGDLPTPVQEEDHPSEKEQMVIARDHVLGAKIDEGDGAKARHLLHIARVAFGDVVGKSCTGKDKSGKAGGKRQQDLPGQGRTPLRPESGNHCVFPD